jgi:hypothetical protein
MTPVGFAIKLALMDRTRVVLSGRRYALGFLRDPLAIRVVPANDLIGLGAAWNAFGRETGAGTGEQDNKRSDGQDVLHRANFNSYSTIAARFGGHVNHV